MKNICLLLLLLATNLHAGEIIKHSLFDHERRVGGTRPNCQDLPAGMLKENNETKEGAAKGNGVCLCDTAATRLPQICSDGKSGAIVCWTERYRATLDSDYDIYAQRVDSAGNIVWQSQGVPVCSLSNTSAWYPKMIADGSGGAIIAWEEWGRDGGSATHVYAQRIDSLGNRVWPENGVTVCNQWSAYVDLCGDGQGGAIIAYVDGRDEAVTSDNIYAQRIDSAGNPVWAIDGVPVCTADSIQFYPYICSNNNGSAFITWGDDYRNNGTTGEDVYAQMLDSLGYTKWAINGEPICVKPGMQKVFGRAVSGNIYSGASITWRDYQVDSALVQAYDSVGNAKWGSDGIKLLDGGTLLNDRKSGVFIANVNIISRVDSIGDIYWDSVALHPGYLGFHGDVNVDDHGNVIVVWDDRRVDPDWSDQYVQKVDTAGTILWGTTGTPACTLQMGYETYPQITSDGVGGAICTWYGTPNHIVVQNRVYVQRVYDNGNVWGVAGGQNDNIRHGVRCFKVFPNPSQKGINIRYSVSANASVYLKIYNITGQLVTDLVYSHQSAGIYDVKWNGRNKNGNIMTSGMYIVRLSVNGINETQKILLIK